MAEQHRWTGWISRTLIVRTLVCLGVLAVPATFPSASATFTGVTASDVNSVTTAQVAPPSSVAVTQMCPTAGSGIASSGRSRTATGLSSLTLTPPDGTVAGDLLVAQVANREGLELHAPAGWTALAPRRTGSGSPTVSSAMYWKWAAANEGASLFTLGTGTGNIHMVGGVVAYRGVHPTNPVDVPGASAHGSGTAAIAPSVTTETAGAMVVHAYAKRQEVLPGGPAALWSLESGTGSGNLGATAVELLTAGPGTVPARYATGSNAFDWVAHTVALRPATAQAPSATVRWTASPSSWATGYRLERSTGGTTQPSTTVTPITATSTVDGPLVNGTAYSYRLWAYHGTWSSTAVTVPFTPSC